MAAFSETSYQLPSCALTALTENQARPLSKHLARVDPWLTLGYGAEGLLRYLLRHDPALSRFAVLVGSSVEGLVCVRYPWLRGPCIELLAVFEGQQGCGLGREIVAWLETQCLGTAPNLWALTSSFNAGARSFYGTVGFSEIVSLPNLVSPGFDEILLRKMVEGSKASLQRFSGDRD